MQVNYHRVRDAALEIALSTRHNVQKALSSAKHGAQKIHVTGCPLSIKDVMYGDRSSMKTLAIHNKSTEYLVAYTWYSSCDVYLKDLSPMLSMTPDGTVLVSIRRDKLDLHVISVVAIVEALGEHCTLVQCVKDVDYVELSLHDAHCNLMNVQLRKGKVTCSAADCAISEVDGTVYTLLPGNRYEQVVSLCDVALTTNSTLNVEYMGKINTAIAYRTYLSGGNVDIYTGTLLYSEPTLAAYDYSHMATSSPIKRLTIREQINSMASVALHGAVDDMTAPESALMAGAPLKS